MGNQDKLKAEESVPISENGYTLGRLLDGTKCQLLMDTGVSKSFMSNHLHAMQITPYLTKIHLNHTKNTSWKWSVC